MGYVKKTEFKEKSIIIADRGYESYNTVAHLLNTANVDFVIRTRHHNCMRWGIETSFRELKYSIGLLYLHSKKIETIYQEVYAALIMYNYCERIAAMAIVKHKSDCLYAYQLNFTMAFVICKKYYRYNYSLDNILDDIEKYISPIRPGRRFNRKPIFKGFINFTYRIAA